MGKRIIISDADYTHFLNDTIEFNFMSDNAEDINLDFANQTLQFKNGGATGHYNWIASGDVNKVKITMPVSSLVGENAFVVGLNNNGDALVFYLTGARGNIFIFPKNGAVSSLVSVYLTSNLPNAPKGTEITLEKISGGINISYTGYSQDILNTEITGFANTAFGVLATGSNIQEYTFKIV